MGARRVKEGTSLAAMLEKLSKNVCGERVPSQSNEAEVPSEAGSRLEPEQVYMVMDLVSTTFSATNTVLHSLRLSSKMCADVYKLHTGHRSVEANVLISSSLYSCLVSRQPKGKAVGY